MIDETGKRGIEGASMVVPTPPLSQETPSRTAPAHPRHRTAPVRTSARDPSSPAGPKNRIRADGKHTRDDIAVSVFHADVSVADFHNTTASEIRPGSPILILPFQHPPTHPAKDPPPN